MGFYGSGVWGVPVPCPRSSLRLLRALLERPEWGSGAATVRSPAGVPGTAAALPPRGWAASWFLCPRSSPSPPQQDQLGSPQNTARQTWRVLRNPVRLWGKGKVVARTQKCSVSLFSKQPLSFPMTFCSVVVNIFVLLCNGKQNYS